MTATDWPFVVLDDRGIAYVQGTTTKVVEIALDQTARELTEVEIRAAYPYLSLPQIHAALGYYYEHQDECDCLIEQRRQRADELLPQLGNPSRQEQLRRKKPGG